MKPRSTLWQSQLKSWLLFDQRQAVAYADFVRALPPAFAPPNFRLARAVLDLVRAERREAFGFATLSPQTCAPFYASRASSRALALDDEAWGWDLRIVELRERALEAPLHACSGLAAEMALIEGPPWVLWACASCVPEALLDALFERGIRHRPHLPLGSMGLPAAMGFSGLPVSSWVSTVARHSTPSGFCADSAPFENFSFLQNVLTSSFTGFPDLPCRTACSPDFSRVLDASDASSIPPATLLIQSALGLSPGPERPAEPDGLGFLLDSNYLRATLSASQAGLPKGFDRRWPLDYAFRYRWHKNFAHVIGRLSGWGADVLDIFAQRALWEHQVEPYSEQGSEGDFAPIDEPLLALLFELGANFCSTRLGRVWAAERSSPLLDRDMSLSEFYEAVLESTRGRQAAELLAPWIARCEARSIDSATDRGARSSRGSRAL